MCILLSSLPLIVNAGVDVFDVAQEQECSETNPLCLDGKLVYERHDKYDTPFNPHEILNTWKTVLQTLITPDGLPFVIMGNPKIDWDKVLKQLNPTLAIIPEDENYAAVVFTFTRMPGPFGTLENGSNELVMVGYRTPSNGIRTIHMLSGDKTEYTTIPKEQLEKEHRKRILKDPNVV